MGATKHDQGKSRLDLLGPNALVAIGNVLEFGASKYAPNNWMAGIAYSRLTGAALRHITAFMRGEDTDPESGLPHLAHAMCNLMFLLEMTGLHPELDDRGDYAKLPEASTECVGTGGGEGGQDRGGNGVTFRYAPQTQHAAFIPDPDDA